MHLRRGFYRARRVTDGFVKVVPREGRCFRRKFELFERTGIIRDLLYEVFEIVVVICFIYRTY